MEEYFKQLKNLVYNLNKKQKEELCEFLSNMEQSIEKNTTLK